MIRDTPTQSRAHAQVLAWQARVRVLVAAVGGTIALLLQRAGVLHGDPVDLLAAITLYITIIALLGVHVRRVGYANAGIVSATVLADLMFIFMSTMASSPPEYYHRILILSFCVLQLTESYFGRRHTVIALVVVVAAYLTLGLFTIADGARLARAEEAWSLLVFVGASYVFVVQSAGAQRRLHDIIELFERVEAGDFSRTYDSRADKLPDTVTRVGRAYNRARLQLANMVLTDPLTSCLNLRGFEQAMVHELSRSARAGAGLALLAVDIDHFKQVNDSHGHLAGDKILREFGALLVRTARGADTVGRTGGEEFSILLPDTDVNGARAAALRICEAVRAHEFVVNGARLRLTASIGGAAGAGAGDDAAAARLKQLADQSLYAAKRGGRDGVRVWNGELLAAG